MKYRPPAEGDTRLDAPLPKYEFPKAPDGTKVLPLVRGNRCVDRAWNEYQNQLLASGKYTYEELYPVDSFCHFDAWEQAHAEDRAREANKAWRPT